MFALLFPSASWGVNITFVNPSVPGTPFWDRVSAAARAAANDLNFNLSIVYGGDNRIFHFDAIKKIAESQYKPDFVIFMPFDGNAIHTFQLLEHAKIPFVTIERTVHADKQAELGLPQVKFHYWLGEVFHDNVSAGKLLANSLINAASEQSKRSDLKIAAISGSFSGESSHRVEGLQASLNQHDDVHLLQVVHANWSRERSRRIIYQLANRFGEIDIVWAASDGMALGVLDSVASGDKNLNPNIVVGGIDWTVEAIEQVSQGNLVASVGGHFMQAAWALIKLYDHQHNVNVFKKGVSGKSYELEAITQKNIEHFRFLAQKVDWDKIDFKSFTLTHSKQAQYQFSFTHLVQLLQQPTIND